MPSIWLQIYVNCEKNRILICRCVSVQGIIIIIHSKGLVIYLQLLPVLTFLDKLFNDRLTYKLQGRIWGFVSLISEQKQCIPEQFFFCESFSTSRNHLNWFWKYVRRAIGHSDIGLKFDDAWISIFNRVLKNEVLLPIDLHTQTSMDTAWKRTWWPHCFTLYQKTPDFKLVIHTL